MIQKIYMRKIRLDQGLVHDADVIDFMLRDRQTRVNGKFRAQGPALTRNVEFHMVRRTCFREQYYTGTRRYMSAREEGRRIPVKLYIRLGWLFINISRYMCSFGLASCVVQENISLLHWITAVSSRKSIGERFGELKVPHKSAKMIYFMIRGR